MQRRKFKYVITDTNPAFLEETVFISCQFIFINRRESVIFFSLSIRLILDSEIQSFRGYEEQYKILHIFWGQFISW